MEGTEVEKLLKLCTRHYSVIDFFPYSLSFWLFIYLLIYSVDIFQFFIDLVIYLYTRL